MVLKKQKDGKAPQKYRMYRGRRYGLWHYHETKTSAKMLVKNYRKVGYRSHMIKIPWTGRYAVYVAQY